MIGREGLLQLAAVAERLKRQVEATACVEAGGEAAADRVGGSAHVEPGRGGPGAHRDDPPTPDVAG